MDSNHQNKYEEYYKWFSIIEGMCNQENYVGAASLMEGNLNNRSFARYKHHLIDEQLHVFIKENTKCQIIKISDKDLSINSESRYMSRHTSDEYCSIKLSTDGSFGNIRYYPESQTKGSFYNGLCYLPRKIYGTSNAHEHITSQIDMTEKLRQQIDIVQRGTIREIYENAIDLHNKIKETVEKRIKQLEEVEEQQTQEDDNNPLQAETISESEKIETRQLTPEEMQEENTHLRQELEATRRRLREAMEENDKLKAKLSQIEREKKK